MLIFFSFHFKVSKKKNSFQKVCRRNCCCSKIRPPMCVCVCDGGTRFFSSIFVFRNFNLCPWTKLNKLNLSSRVCCCCWKFLTLTLPCDYYFFGVVPVIFIGKLSLIKKKFFFLQLKDNDGAAGVWCGNWSWNSKTKDKKKC